MPIVVPLTADPAQEVRITLGGQRCRVRVYSREIEVPTLAGFYLLDNTGTIPLLGNDGNTLLFTNEAAPYPTAISQILSLTRLMFLDLYIDDVLLIAGVRAYHDNKIVRDAYLGFQGDLAFHDVYGAEDPWYSELGSRWFLLYWSKAELASV